MHVKAMAIRGHNVFDTVLKTLTQSILNTQLQFSTQFTEPLTVHTDGRWCRTAVGTVRLARHSPVWLWA